ncbi:hypothetical protein A6E15_17350 [Natrinema saccharevitans]|uniref:DUF7979 domain-containing protein n=1 Tax=Natrinema saccharevitans TaxID=301967 RepID=A0A1S8AR12_9EURY|nr:hypothetical protein [Natrinema saccharevitans]OLZ39175.1 hypothetical protein A6E15_17350 [Natrinema saccharevitans]
MAEKINLSRVEQVPPDARVYHYDELPERAKTHLPRLVDAEASEVFAPERVAEELEPYDLVKFTEYYRITVREDPLSTPQFS